ncbi:folylpolyglutamate synthase/dihydrofolate synthase family protein [Anaerolineales bacterium HSG25]|nr:folylpolyglutamate synthase/dihydrofolate synthase family protein [Anaerolineales bacterium HSG25]
MLITTYHEALTYIYSYISYNPADTSRWNLSRLNDLLDRMGNPHQQCPSILIAGTKGKGSTAAVCERILQTAGHKTGLYTSPHVHSFRERIRIGGELIAEELLVSLINRYHSMFEATDDLTTFELITALAFAAFAETGVSASVIEVGLGGRLDATNVINPAVSVITPISYDHMQILGDTLTLIAREKAGIIRPQGLVVSAPQPEEARLTIEAFCAEKEADLYQIEQLYTWLVTDSSSAGQRVVVQPLSGDFEPLTMQVPLIGDHQVVNALTALTAVRRFARKTGLIVHESALTTGIATVEWPGRMEILSQEPYLIVDSAMNGDSAEKLAQTLTTYFPGQPITLLFGVSNDHPINDMLTALLPIAKQTFVVASRHPRAEKPARLVEFATALGYQVSAMPDVSTALETVLAQAEPNSVVCVAGSLFLSADVREIWLKKNAISLPPVDPVMDFRPE